MFRKTVLIALLTTTAAGQFGRQNAVTERRATILGGGVEQGKCTIEVDVDDVAEVEVIGDLGILRTLSGQVSTWRRMECSAPMPRNMSSFEFKGIDGRGRQTLVQDPRNNGGRAVIRIEDPKGGREGYTFDLLWRGGGNQNGFIRSDPRDFARVPRDRAPDFGPELNFAGRGDGYFRTRNGNDRIGDLEVSVRGGDVRTTFRTSNGATLFFTGRVVRSEPTRITADMSGEPASGTMIIDIERGRVRSVTMSGGVSQRNRFDLRWHN